MNRLLRGRAARALAFVAAAIFHSPTQIQVEYLCDVVDFPQSWVPASVRMSAQQDANERSASRFINDSPYFCGDPRPW